MANNDLQVANGVLTVNKDLRQDFDLAFDEACNELLESKTDSLIIDLTAVSYINSTYIGMIAATYFQAQAMKKELKVVAQESVLTILKSAGFDGFIKLEAAAV
ncbi:MAG: STAS domain-containing protein [Planctomycetes bacterium]|nr:STAS domain-containing protein [Planctomycetota bacterium]